MLHNIFSNKKKITSETKKPIVTIDVHEKNSLVPAELTKLGVEIQLTNLQVGDYLINNIIIERKTLSDFISSMLSKRLIQQLINMQQYEKKVLIIEGKEDKSQTNIHPNSIRGMILATCLEMNIPIIQTKDEKETATYLFLLAKKQLKPQNEMSFHARIPKTTEERKMYILESFPDIGPKTAEKLLKEFKTIKNIINATKEELEKSIGQKASVLKVLVE